MLASTDLILGLTDDERLVAFARVITDETYIALLLDVVVAEDHRGRSIGTALVDAVLAQPLLATPDSIYGELAAKAATQFAAGKTVASDEIKAIRADLAALRPTMVYSGPYKIDTATVTESQMTFVKNPGGLFADQVNFDKVVVYQGETAQVSPLVLAGTSTTRRTASRSRRQGDEGRGHPRRAAPLYTGPALVLPLGEGGGVPGRASPLGGRARDQQGRERRDHLRGVRQGSEVHGRCVRRHRPALVSAADQAKLKPYEFSLAKADRS